MEGDTGASEGEFMAWCLRQPIIPYHKLATLCPDFLVISPPKTGSTWLAANLRCHPEVFVPEVKEVKYFSSYFKWLDLDWYLNHFGPGIGRVKGEASPSYAILPVERIRLIRRLMPDAKLIFLMRDPVSRAWSHAKHNYRYREANFAWSTGEFADIPESLWIESFQHEWPLTGGDYLGQLRRWLSVFPREQFYVGFYESIAHSPQTLLREVFRFLGVAPDVELTRFPVTDRILPGPSGELTPGLQSALQQLLGGRSRELASFLRVCFGLDVPPDWAASLTSADGSGSPSATVFHHEFDDRYLARVVAQEEAFPSTPRLVLDDYRGYHLAFYRGRFFAIARGAPVRVDQIGEAELGRHQDNATCFIAASLAEVKETVDQYFFDRGQAALQVIDSLQATLEDTRKYVSHLEEGLRHAVSHTQRIEEALRRVEADVARRRPLRFVIADLFRKGWRRLRTSLKDR